MKDMNTFSVLARVFSECKYDSDNFWELVTEVSSNNFKKLTWTQKMDLMKAYSTARRGSNELWEHFIKHVLDDPAADQLERDVALVAYSAEVDLPKELIQAFKIDSAVVASKLEQRMRSNHKYYSNSTTAENLAYLALKHPWVSGEEAKMYEECLRESFAYVARPSMERIKNMYEEAAKSSAIKTSGITDLIQQQTIQL